MEPTKDTVVLSAFDVIQKEAAISTEDGNQLFEKIDQAFQGGKKVELNFTNIKMFISSFLNAAIGQLYSKYDSEFLRNNFVIKGLSSDGVNLLRLVIERAKSFYENQEKFDKTVNDFMPDE